MRSQYMHSSELSHILAALTPENRLACEISLCTGLRISDVLSLRTGQIKKQRFTVKEMKTGKTRFVYLPKELWERALKMSGTFYVFEHRLNSREHRTRQAVFKDLRRAAVLFRCSEHISPHSLRKAFAVEEFHKTCDIKRVQKLLNHSDEAVTYLYAMADIIDKRKNRGLTK